MSEEMNGQVERRTTQGVVSASSSSKSSSSKETVAKSKQQWRGPRRFRSVGQNQDSHQGYPNPRANYENRGNPQYRHVTPDKRPGPRGGYQNVPSRNNNAGEFNDAMDYTSGKATPSSKKIANSLNYLLNFKYATRERGYDQRARFNSRRYSSFNKERFLQANCQFIVNDSADYTVYAIEPDTLVDWSFIEQVRIFSHEVPSCPICLFPPKAAKITRCGHVYCWSCILHYLSLSEKSWRKCPICFESVTKQNLKSVVAMESHHYGVGQTITMRLMKKMKNTTLALPKSQWQERDMKPFKINDSVDTCYSKLLLASHVDVLNQIIETEETALNVQLTEAKLEESSEVCFIESALAELKARKDGLKNKQKCVEDVCGSLERVSLPSSDEGSSDGRQEENIGWNVHRPEKTSSQDAEAFEPAFSDDEDTVKGASSGIIKGSVTQDPDVISQESSKATDVPVDTTTDQETVSPGAEPQTPTTVSGESGDSPGGLTRRNGSFSASHDQTYSYFYQADDGQNIFLHPINARCLIKEYGSLENCPEYISAKIFEIEAMSQTEESRKRYRYLSHLPLTCEFVICELDLKPPVVSTDTLEYFRVEIQKRKQRRQKKMKVEKRRELRVDAKMASIEGRPINCGRRSTEPLNLTSDVDFPTQSLPTLVMAMSPLGHKPGPFTQLAAAATSYNDEDEGLVGYHDDATGQEANGTSPPSFAQALRTGKAVEMAKPVRRQQNQVQGSTKVTDPRGEESDEDYIPPPTYQSTFSDALSVAICESLNNHLKTDVSQAHATVGGGKKQKKNKRKLLFTTGHMKFN